MCHSMVPLSEWRNDAYQNFFNALTVAQYQIPEVLIVCENKVLRGN